MKVKAIAPWFGAKRSMAARIVRECMPDDKPPRAFWDLCCGSLAVSMAMPHCAHHTAIDLHGDLINLANIIKDSLLGPKFYRRLRRMMFHEQCFKEAKSRIQTGVLGDAESGLFDEGHDVQSEADALQRAIDYFVVCWQGRNGVAGTERVNYQPCMRWTSGGGAGGVRFANTVDSIPSWRRRLRSIYVSQRNIFEVIEKIEDQVGTVLYLDPPYVRDGARTGNAKYEHEFTGLDHHRLARVLGRFKNARVVCSYYEHSVLRELYDGWSFVDCSRNKNLHVQNRRGQTASEAPEVLIINGPSYTALAEAA